MRLRHLAAALAAAIPLTAPANGGAGVYEERTSGAVAGAQPGALRETALVQEDDVECLSEHLTIKLTSADVRVQVEYVFVNRGKTKTLRYAFPFALGLHEATRGGRVVETRRLGEPATYELFVDGAPVGATVSPGGPVPQDIAVPRLADWPYETSAEPTDPHYRWSYRVSDITFPAGLERRIRVTYVSPYLVYSMRSTEYGTATSPGEVSYVLSTGGGWRGGTIGQLQVTVTGDGVPIAWIRPAGLPFKRDRSGWTFQARDFRPTTATNIVVQRSELARRELGLEWGLTGDILGDAPVPPGDAWVSPPVGGAEPVRIQVKVGEWAEPGAKLGGERWPGTTRYRLRVAFAPGSVGARLTRARVALEFAERPTDVFHANFPEADPKDVAASGGYRAIWFDAPATPTSITLVPLEVVPGAKGDRRLRITGVKLEQDVSNHAAAPYPN